MKKKILSIILSILVLGTCMFTITACSPSTGEPTNNCEHVADGSGYCSLCNEIIGSTEGVLYRLSDDESYAEVIGHEGVAKNVIIAKEYNGKPVKSIYEEAFYSSSIKSVVIPDSVTSIGHYAFYDCDSLTSVTIGNSVTSIGDDAFAYCDSLTSITIPNSVTSIGGYAFYGCGSLTSITIPNSVTSIGEGVFRYCDSLTSVVIGDSVTSIGGYVFYGCYRLVEVINKSAHITVEKGSPSNGYVGYYALAVYNSGDTFTGTKLSNDNGYIIYTDGNEKILVGYNGAQTDLILPNYITKINNYAFDNCDSLTSITIPNSVTSIGNHAFDWCKSLTSITIPNSVTSIGNYAFYGCSSLTSIKFSDTTTWYITNNYSNWIDKTGGTQTSVTDASTNATYFTFTRYGYYYYYYYWYKL